MEDGSTDASSASGTINAYNTENGARASTTGNIYGIYDMSGGSLEYNASYEIVNNTGLNSSYGKNLVIETKQSDSNTYISTKYATK